MIDPINQLDLLNEINDLIQSVAPDGRFLYVNQAWLETLGYDAAEVERLNIFDIIHADSREHCAAMFERVMRGEKLRGVEAEFVAKNGAVIAVEGSANCEFRNGQPFATRSIFHDVTARKRAVDELARRERELTALLESAGDVIARFDQDLRYVYANSAIERATGQPPAAFLGKTNHEAGMPPEIYQHWENVMRRVFATQTEAEIEFDFPTPAGNVHFFSKLTPVFDARRNVESVLVVSRDITDLKRAQQNLRDSESRFQAFMQNSPVVAFMKDAAGRMMFANSRLEAMFHLKFEDIAGKTDFEWLPADVAAAVRENDKAVMETGAMSELIETVPTPDGAAVHWLVYKFLFSNDAGEKFIGGAAVDITARKAAEEKLERLALTDELTGLYNQRGFMLLAGQQLELAAQARGKPTDLLLLYIDLDGLKRINDTHGHQQGSELIAAAAQVLRRAFRGSDIIARLGGDEFAVLSINANHDDAASIAARVQREIDEFNQRDQLPFELAMSVGVVAVKPQSPPNLQDLLDAADQIMYRQKRDKRCARQ